MTYSEICKAVETVINKYDERNPFRLIRDMDISLIFDPLGYDDDCIKGFFTVFCRVRCITINSDLPEVIQRIIAAHELGHAVMHCKNGVYSFKDFGVFDESSEMEKDANLFAAELLLDDEEVLDCLNADTTFSSAAAKLRVPAELLDFKFRVMKWKGCKLSLPTINAQSNFLRNMDIPRNADYF